MYNRATNENYLTKIKPPWKVDKYGDVRGKPDGQFTWAGTPQTFVLNGEGIPTNAVGQPAALI